MKETSRENKTKFPAPRAAVWIKCMAEFTTGLWLWGKYQMLPRGKAM